MRLWHILGRRLQSVFRRNARESDLREELQLHIERDVERLHALGLSHEDARLQALRLFGGVEQIKEACRDARGTAGWDALVRDVQHAGRRLRREWRFTAGAVLILGLGIGATTATFSLVNAALFRDQGLPDPARLVNIYQNDRAGRPLLTSYAAYLEMAEYRDIFAGVMASVLPGNVSYLAEGAVRGGIVEYTTPTALDVLGLRPSHGRWFVDAEDKRGAPLVAVVSHQLWTSVFRADPAVVGRIILMQGVPVTIVGVGPANHRGSVDVGLVMDFWLPTTAIPALMDTSAATNESSQAETPSYFVKARLRDGVTVPQVQAAMDILGRRRAADRPHPELSGGVTVIASTEVRVHPQADAPILAVASLVLVIIGLVLAIACSNLATLLLVRGAARGKEVSVRLAIGATRRQIVRHLLTESLLLSLLGGLTGCLMAWWGIRWLRRLDLPVMVDVSLDLPVLGFALAVSVVTGVAFGLAPALKATRIDVLPTLRDEATPSVDHRRLTMKNGLIVFQVAVSVLLLGGTSIFLQMLSASRALPVGYAVNGVAMLETDVRYAGYSGTEARNLYDDLLRRIAASPGVESAALLRGLPMQGAGVSIVTDAASQGSSVGEAAMFAAGPGFFETLRIPLLAGRVFDARDRADTPRVAVITERMARRYFGEVNAVGRRFRLDGDQTAWTEIIGVVRDTGTGDYGDDVLDPIAPPFYLSYTQSGALPTTVIARTSRDAASLVAAMQRELRTVDVNLPVMTAKTMAQDLEDKRAASKTAATLLGVLGGLGLMLASIGIYAVVAFTVARRSREIGIRMALGAQSPQVVWNVAREVAVLIGAGTGVGIVLSALVILAMRGFSNPTPGLGNIVIYSPSFDPVGLLAIAAVITVVGAAATFMPARRAARMDPLRALRHD